MQSTICSGSHVTLLVILNLFQDNTLMFPGILKQFQDDERLFTATPATCGHSPDRAAPVQFYFPVQLPGRFSTNAAMPSF